MQLDCIEKAIDSGLILHTWEDKQSSGVWAAMADEQSHLSSIQELSKRGLKENIWLKNFTHGEGNELLIALSETFESALNVLESRLQEMSNKIYEKDGEYRAYLCSIYATMDDNM